MDIQLENYTKKIQIESRTIGDIAINRDAMLQLGIALTPEVLAMESKAAPAPESVLRRPDEAVGGAGKGQERK